MASKQFDPDYRSLVEHAPDVITRFDRDYRHVYVNPAVEKAIGMAPEDIIGKDNTEIGMPPDFVKKWQKTLQKVFDTGKEQVIEMAYPAGDGMIYFLNRIVPEIDSKGKVASVISYTREITRLKEAELALQQAHDDMEERVRKRTKSLKKANEKLQQKNQELERINEDLDSFVYSASHDLKSPIINIRSLMDLLKKEERTDGEMAQFAMNKIEKSLEKITQTLSDMSDAARAQRNMFDDVEYLRFSDIVHEVIEENSELMRTHKARFEMDFSEVAGIAFSRTALKSILYNLLTNAVKYSSPDRRPVVSLYAKQLKNRVKFTVQDNGIGVDLSKGEQRVFGLFKRMHDHVEGTGIGLYIVKKLVENNGGTITVNSQVGQGTTFTVSLPVKQ